MPSVRLELIALIDQYIAEHPGYDVSALRGFSEWLKGETPNAT